MTSYDICLWLTSVPQIDGETMETMTDIFRGSKITVDGDCSPEIKRRLLLGSKVMTNLDSILEKAMAPHSCTLAWKTPGRRSLEGCSPWGRWGSDTTERLHFHFSLSCIGEGNGNPLQCSCLENPRDRGAWWAAIYGVAQSRTRLKWLSSMGLDARFFYRWERKKQWGIKVKGQNRERQWGSKVKVSSVL